MRGGPKDGGDDARRAEDREHDSRQGKTGLDDPRAVEILTTEHWSLLSTRTLGYQEMFGRAAIFTAILSAALVALALLAQVTHFTSVILAFALVLLPVSLFIGLVTFVRAVDINYGDARCVAGMALLRRAYLRILPELEPYFVADLEPGAEVRSLGYGRPQRSRELAKSLTTTSSVVAALNSVLAGAIASAVGALLGGMVTVDLTAGAIMSLLSAALHVRYAARYRRRRVGAASAALEEGPEAR